MLGVGGVLWQVRRLKTEKGKKRRHRGLYVKDVLAQCLYSSSEIRSRLVERFWLLYFFCSSEAALTEEASCLSFLSCGRLQLPGQCSPRALLQGVYTPGDIRM